MSKANEAEALAAQYSQLTSVAYFEKGKRQIRVALRIGDLNDKDLENLSVNSTVVTRKSPTLATIDSARREYKTLPAALKAEAKLVGTAKLCDGELEIWVGNRTGTRFQRERGSRFKKHLNVFESAWREALKLPKLTDDELQAGREQAANRLCTPIVEYLRLGRKGLAKLNKIPEFEKRRLPDIAKESFVGLNLRKCDLMQLRFPGCNFSLGKLSKALFSRCELTSAIFTGANLSQASFVEAIARKANFCNTDLTEATFSGSDLRNASFDGADLTECDLMSADLRGAVFTKCKLSKAVFAGAVFNDATKWPARFKIRENMVRRK